MPHRRKLASLMIVTFLAFAPPARAEDLPPSPARMDVSTVTAIRITGDASSIRLTTGQSEPYRATLGGRRSGWFARWYSSWFYSDCRTASRMHMEGTVLLVEASPGSWMEPSDCAIEFQANVPAGVSLEVAQAASELRLTGDFKTISLNNKAADIVLDGHASSLDLHGDAMRSSLTFSRVENNETMSLAGQSLDTSIRLPAGTEASYQVQASAAMVDSTLPDTKGAKPAIDVRAQYTRLVIR